ncbi:uncharacterized protein N7506_003482 [Penicillium brevicompactum]|uniref:uncharacterized protein n=1 Tax=Penicillium brevicompactum TaxID=5074 RepID=UPI00254031F3|nr:uncharacterized protein N7506_003482 [Penicillium brevicompactum]KAJ5343658.1 hypothetical protein N7506_003482 [Penicillium brevicompactum]
MAQYSDPAKQFGGDFSGQAGPQGQGFYPQQGPAGPLPQGLYPTMNNVQKMQQPGHMQFPVQASQQGSPAPYEQQYPQSQVPGGAYLGTPQPSAGTLPYPQQQNMPLGENASYYGTLVLAVQKTTKGLGSTVVGGAAGGYAGHKLGGGLLGSAAGAVLGAIGMNAATHQV